MSVPLFIVKYYLQKHSKFASFLACLLLFTIIFYRYILVTLLVWSFVFGVTISYCFISRDFLLPNLLPLFQVGRNRKNDADIDDEFTLMKTICTVCGQRRCPRHRPELNILAFQPWTGLEIRQSVDLACEEFLTIVLNEFVYTWYKNVSKDEEFVDELRTSIRFLFSVLLRRIKKVDVPGMLAQRLIKAGIQHLHAVLQARSTGTDIQDATLRYLGPNLHYAMQSRKAEQEYIRRMVEKLFPYILRPQALESKSMCALLREILAASVIMPAMDAIANPDMVNNILLVILDEMPSPAPAESPSPMVAFLANFSNQIPGSLSDPEQTAKISKSSLRFVLGDVMDPEKPSMLYPFMQFLKSEAAINVLQFALACEDFNKKILDPDLSTQDLSKLHEDLKELNRTYFSYNSCDRINFEENIVAEVQEIIEGVPNDVLKLRRSTPMFRAYEHAYNLLNKTFLPLFHQSEEYYIMICGERLASQVSNRSIASKQPRKKDMGIASFGSKIKEVFKPSDTRSISSLDHLDIDNTDDADTVTVASASSLEDEAPYDDIEHPIDHFQPHDLSTWRLSIPKLAARPDPENPKKQFFVFVVDIRRVDIPEEGRSQWTCDRKYTEFYTLEQKLKEFHGDLGDCLLPPKKLLGTKNYEFIDGKREPFESYLQKLLTVPILKGSQLLYNFLTAHTAFDFGLDINIGRVLKSVPRKLVKERGQHLESFLYNLEKSTEPPKPRPSKQERRDSEASLLSTSSLKLCHSVYENNANGLERRDEGDADLLLVERSDVEGIYDTLIYLARFVYRVPDWCHHVLYAARMFLKTSLEAYLDFYVDLKIYQVTQEHRLVSLIHLLRDVLFFDTDPPRTDDEKRQRYQETEAACLDFLPKAVVLAMGENNHIDGTQLLLYVLQQPKLNKQLSYVLLDIIITELFPELFQ